MRHETLGPIRDFAIQCTMHALAHWFIVYRGNSAASVYSLLANHIQEPAALAKLSKSVQHANAVRCRRKPHKNLENTDILTTTTTTTMALNDKQYDAIVDILVNKAIERLGPRTKSCWQRSRC
jgi:hypothetical protein